MTRARDVANIDGILTTTGDTYYASAAATPSRLAIGSTGNVLTVSGGVPVWSAPAGGAASWTLISSQAVSSGSSVSFTGLTGQYDNLMVTWSRFTTSWGNDWGIRFNSDSSSNYRYVRLGSGAQAYNNDRMASAITDIALDYGGPNFGLGFIRISGAASNGNKYFEGSYNTRDTGNNAAGILQSFAGIYTATAPLSSIQLQMLNGSQTYTSGSQFYLYGA